MHRFLPPGAIRVADFVEVESARPHLAAAIAQREGYMLLVPKLDRLATLMESCVRF